MAGIRQVYTFKCKQGHMLEMVFASGTDIDKNDETTCRECLKKNAVEISYVVFVRPETAKDRKNVNICA